VRKKLASLLVAGGLLATLSISGLFVVQQNQADPGSGNINSLLPTSMNIPPSMNISPTIAKLIAAALSRKLG